MLPTQSEQADLKAPGYFCQFPHFVAIKRLRKILGTQDTTAVAIYTLLVDFKAQAASKSKSFEELFLEKGKENGVPVSFNDFNQVELNIYHLLIINVYNVFDPFAKSFIKDVLLLSVKPDKSWVDKKGQEKVDAFNQIINNAASNSGLKKAPEYYLLDYYRLVRNAIVHKIVGEERFKESDKLYDSHILKNLEYFKSTYGLEAPNKGNDINYDDFFLYTRAIKYYMNLVSDAYYTPVFYGLVTLAVNDVKTTNKLNGYRNVSEERLEKLTRKLTTNIYQRVFKLSDPGQVDRFYQMYKAESTR